MVVTYRTNIMGFKSILEFDVFVDSFGCSYTQEKPVWYVDACKWHIDPSEHVGGVKTSVTGAFLTVLATILAEEIERTFMSEAAEEYWTDKWSGGDC